MGFLSICRRYACKQPVFVAQAYFFLERLLYGAIALVPVPAKIGNAELFGNLLHAAVKSLRVVAFNRSAFCPLQSCSDSVRDSALYPRLPSFLSHIQNHAAPKSSSLYEFENRTEFTLSCGCGYIFSVCNAELFIECAYFCTCLLHDANLRQRFVIVYLVFVSNRASASLMSLIQRSRTAYHWTSMVSVGISTAVNTRPLTSSSHFFAFHSSAFMLSGFLRLVDFLLAMVLS